MINNTKDYQALVDKIRQVVNEMDDHDMVDHYRAKSGNVEFSESAVFRDLFIDLFNLIEGEYPELSVYDILAKATLLHDMNKLSGERELETVYKKYLDS